MASTSKTSVFNLFFLLFPCLFFFFFFFFFFIQYPDPVAGDFLVTPYIPIENIAINCGSLIDSLASNGRPWSADNSSKFSVIHSQTKQPVFLSASTGHEPYLTSRVSYSEFTYLIPLSVGPKFIRFHFYLRSYPGFDLSKAFFTVKAGQFTLLRNFSALLHAQEQQTLVKEFRCVCFDQMGRINLPSFLKFGEVAISCLASEGMKRPAMSEVVYALELALKLQGSEVNGDDENHANDSSAVDYHVLYTSGSGSMNVGRWNKMF
ncbi:hypothetical protein V6N11_041212 [Hibiscus sabdariffa]|uniref:Malectin-like domain-containing protein n=1 Tax=Hibiscus sabdariffa TaxID=183260 RepID=A0ABR2RK73_9ROSI